MTHPREASRFSASPTPRLQADPRPIAITMGDPAGIGPETVLRLLLGPAPAPASRATDQALPVAQQNLEVAGTAKAGFGSNAVPTPFIVYGDPGLLAREARRLGLSVGHLVIRPCSSMPLDVPMGQVDARAGEAAYRAVRQAADDAMSGLVRAVVTAPLNKEAMNAAGFRYPGHTEILAEVAGGVPVRMMLANQELRTVLVTIHLPLRAAIEALSRERILDTILLTHEHLKRAGILAPRLAVAGLNPHAGEAGLLGREEMDIIAPAVQAARCEGVDASGPYPPDTVFMQARGFHRFDAVVAMYHDQGLIPVKYLGLEDGVNITVGLPFVRTSPDHGTAFDIAGQGRADIRSLAAAVRMADEMSRGPAARSNPTSTDTRE